MTLEIREIAVHIAWLEELCLHVPHKSPWNMTLLPMKKSGTTDSPKSDSSRETGVNYLGPDALFSFPWAEVNQSIFAFK